jgi:alkylhydroperoxidase family enzyme
VDALASVEWESCLLEPVRNPEVERMLRKELGVVSPGARYFLDSPWLTRAAARLDLVQMPTLHVTPALAEMIALVVSQENACRYCYAATRLLMTILGFAESRIRSIEEDLLSGELSDAERLALQFARAVSRASPLPTTAAVRPLLEAGFSPGAVKEIAVLAAANIFFNRLSTLPALPPADWEFGHSWYARLLRPFLARRLQPRRATAPVPLAREERTGPFAAIIVALDGLPVAPRLRATIDEAWTTTVLPQRTVALVLAVVARGIGCPRSEAEAMQLLADSGMTAAQIDSALAHLGGSALDARDHAAVSLARESLWYRPAVIQRHARSIRELFTRQQFVELIGMTSLANMLCRLAIATELGDGAQ